MWLRCLAASLLLGCSLPDLSYLGGIGRRTRGQLTCRRGQRAGVSSALMHAVLGVADELAGCRPSVRDRFRYAEPFDRA